MPTQFLALAVSASLLLAPTATWAETKTFFVDTETGDTFSHPSELPESISEWLRPDIKVLGEELLPELKPYLRDGIDNLLAEYDAAMQSDDFGQALSYIIPKWWPHIVEVSLATDEDGSVVSDQVFFVHGDQANHYNSNRGKIKTASDARRYFDERAELSNIGIIRRPEVQSPKLRTEAEAEILQTVFRHLEEDYGFSTFGVIAQSGAFPLMHDIAVKRGNFGCLVGSSGVGDQLAFFRHYNTNTSVTWANAFLNPVGQVQELPKETKVVVVHDPRDNVVVVDSMQIYVDAAKSAGVDITANLKASASDSDRHDTVGVAATLYNELCDN